MNEDWLEKHFHLFLEEMDLGYLKSSASSIILSDGDKCDSYEREWLKHDIPFEHGVALYLITKYEPYSNLVRETINGWVAPKDWVINNYLIYKPIFNKIENSNNKKGE